MKQGFCQCPYETIDAIARRLGRDVIFLDIRNGEDRPVRDRSEIVEATAWLDAEGIGWTACLGFVPGMLLIEGGPRAVHIEPPFEPGSATLASLEARFETADGRPRHHPRRHDDRPLGSHVRRRA